MTASFSAESRVLPLLPLRDVVVFPHMVIPLFVGRPKSIKALEAAMEEGKNVVLVAQKSAAKDEPNPEDLYEVGTVSTILQMLKLPDGTVKVLVEGVQRAKIERVLTDKANFEAEIELIASEEPDSNEVEAMRRTLLAQFDQYVKLNKKIPPEVLTSLAGIDGAGRLSDTIAAHLPLKLEQKQQILENFHVGRRLEQLLQLLETEIDIMQVEKRIRGRVKRQMEKSQREYYLNEQVKAIQKELGDSEEGADLDELEKKIKSAHMPKEARAKAEAELKKLKLMSPMSAEATVVRNYIDTLVALPWKKKTKVSTDLKNSEKILDADHYGLEKVKERIVEYLAVQQRVDKLKAPILCLVGPPGVGKTSLGRSIAKATGREFARQSLGGVRDEAEIRGHRRTYIGSLPGKIISNLKKAGTSNPLFLLDEIDKLGQDFRGDPASALLEVLDPEQNNRFQDHYLELDYDLSDVMFVTTANSLDMPQPLLDRMEIIRLEGYTEDEKVEIAKRHLIPKQIEAHGLKDGELEYTDDGLRAIIRHFTREAGVRTLERELAKIARKSLRQILESKTERVSLTEENVGEYLGVRRFRYGVGEEEDQIGAVTGLAWTEVGGELLTIEAVTVPGKGQIKTTGKLGEVMTESIATAMSFVKARSPSYGVKPSIFARKDIHVHLPEGAVPKDGPSAGVGMVTAMISTLTAIPVRRDIAMTGEVTLRGRVLPIGGLKEKLLAALRGGIQTVLIPAENEKDLAEIPASVKEALEIIPVAHVDEVLARALSQPMVPIEWTEADDQATDPVVHPTVGGDGATVRH
jgi:ATP-dependent Lon protease